MEKIKEAIVIPNNPFGEYEAQARVIALCKKKNAELVDWQEEIIDEVDFDFKPMKKITVELKEKQ